MRDHDDELVFGDLLEDLHDLHGGLGVQRAGGLVGKEDVRVVDQGAGNGHALHLAAGHLIGLLVELIGEADLLQRLRGAAAALRGGDARECQRELDVGEHALVRDEVIGLEDEADGVVAVGVPVAVAEVFGGLAVDNEVTGAVLVEAAYDVQQRRLAAAGVTENGHELVPAEAQAHALERVHDRVARRIVLFDVDQFEHSIHSGG